MGQLLKSRRASLPILPATGIGEDTVDVALRGISAQPGVYLDPNTLASAGVVGRERIGGKPAFWRAASLAVERSDTSGLGGRVGFVFNDRDADLLVGPGVVTASFTMLCALTVDASLKNGTIDGYLLAAYNPSTGYEQSFRFVASTGGWGFQSSQRQGGGVNSPAAAVPAAGARAIIGVSYSSETDTVEIYNGAVGTPAYTATTGADPTVDAIDRTSWGVGNTPFTSGSGWRGRMGKMLIWPKAMHVAATDKADLASVMAAMKSFYNA